ncbi:hypothetical protein PsorP6_014223 [Peronosclerospora sorghi]|uniref:Uncharacterized protein n=1 Tax=Peronosclerospora sorghi TaxID=230839 RepID=A0ACC0VHA2_9STRA|nr:hypothetical protein PsorP6_014223 [Peronosclerospora sorghi]
MYMANTMATSIEMLGLSLPYSSSFPADSKEKQNEFLSAGEATKVLLEKYIKPLDILSREVIENAITITMALGGSRNSVLHLIAIARAENIPLTINDFEKGFINGDCLTVTGTTLGENLAHVPGLSDNHEIIHTVDRPLKSSRHLRILRGELAPEGSVANITGKEGLVFAGTAKVYDCEEDMMSVLENNEITKRSVIHGKLAVLTSCALLLCSGAYSAIMGDGLSKDVAMLTDGRFSGGSHGFIIGHITPRRKWAVQLRASRMETRLKLMRKNRIDLTDVSAEELAQRKKEWVAPPLKDTRGLLYKFIKNVNSASEGCITDE